VHLHGLHIAAKKMVEHFGLDVVQAYMKHVQDNAEEAVRRAIASPRDGSYESRLDNGAVIKVVIGDRTPLTRCSAGRC